MCFSDSCAPKSAGRIAARKEGQLRMSEIITLEVSDPLLARARSIAQQTDQRVEDVLIAWLNRAAEELPVDLLSDEQVLSLRDLQMDVGEQAELSTLLARQREGALTVVERIRLDELLRNYRHGMVRKAHALKVAIERGLQPRLSDTYGA